MLDRWTAREIGGREWARDPERDVEV